MGKRPPRDPQTKDVLLDIQRRKRRRRLLAYGGWGLTAVALLVLFVGAVWVTLGNDSDVALGENPPFDPSLTTDLTTSTTMGPTTTRPPPPRPDTTAAPRVASPTTTAASAPVATATTGQPASPPTPAADAPVIVIDPGHQARGNNELEPIGPGSAERKPKVSSGTRGTTTGTPEHELVLAVALKLRALLEQAGAQVLMTRETANVDISNIERTQLANEASADLYVRIHADGAGSSSARGIHVLYPAAIDGWTDDIAAPSKQAAQIVQPGLIRNTGAKDLGLDARTDISGFNWSDVPVILPEIGFMTNPDEDRLLATDAYRGRIARGLAEGILEFVGK